MDGDKGRAGMMDLSLEQESAQVTMEPLVHVSTPFLLVSMVPLALIALISVKLDLDLASPVVVGCLRTFVQLTVLGVILEPIFVLGQDYWWLVLIYICFMVLLAAREAAAKTKYYFEAQIPCVLLSLLTSVTFVSIFAFGCIIRPHPYWDPHYVIPIVGMLLGNCINAIALSLDTMLVGLVEQQSEIELLLAFGATGVEASSRLVREAVRTGATPMVNSMAVIGLVSIPGMMTGQILGGTPAMEAARYQMLIVYLIAMCAFGTILVEVWLTRKVAFDWKEMLRTDRFTKREKKKNFLAIVADSGRICCRWVLSFRRGRESEIEALIPEDDDGVPGSYAYVSPKGSMQIRSVIAGDESMPIQLDVNGLARSVPITENDVPKRRFLFRNLNVVLRPGEVAAVSGPSGVGKSQLLRVVAGLSWFDSGTIMFNGKRQSDYSDWTLWRQQVRYVTQHKVDMPGTPRDFLRKVSSLSSYKSRSTPSFDDMLSRSLRLVQTWGLASNCLDKEWVVLSGGETQRVIVAMALASGPKILLLDESTSALDIDSKKRVERSIESAAAKFHMSILWITHDEEQLERMGSKSF